MDRAAPLTKINYGPGGTHGDYPPRIWLPPGVLAIGAASLLQSTPTLADSADATTVEKAVEALERRCWSKIKHARNSSQPTS
jgi:hypothetical protein